MPAWDDQTQFEFLILEGAQAGLSWSTILNKREGYREAFAGFDPERIARFGKRELARLMKNPGIVRNRLKVESAITNARAYLDFQSQHGGFAKHLWTLRRRQADPESLDAAQAGAGRPRPNRMRSARISSSAASSFVGSTIIYAHMQATGMVNDHVAGCFRYKECKALGKPK